VTIADPPPSATTASACSRLSSRVPASTDGNGLCAQTPTNAPTYRSPNAERTTSRTVAFRDIDEPQKIIARRAPRRSSSRPSEIRLSGPWKSRSGGLTCLKERIYLICCFALRQTSRRIAPGAAVRSPAPRLRTPKRVIGWAFPSFRACVCKVSPRSRPLPRRRSKPGARIPHSSAS